MGERPTLEVAPGQCASIGTGGMLPAGADAVVMVEHTRPVEADLIEQPTYSQSYPFESVTIQNVPTGPSQDKAVGFDIGLGVDYVFSERFALAAQFRFSRATVGLASAQGNTVDASTGGPEAALGLRFIF